MVKNWLITGGCGYIGTSLIEKLIELDSSVNIRVLDNLTVGSEEDLAEVANFKKITEIISSPNGVELFIGDIKNEQDCLSASKGVDCIVHLAANTGVGPSVENPKIDMEANVIGTFNMLETARLNNVKNFIFASSGAPIGELKNPPIHEELPAHPVSPYGASKLAGEGYCSAYYQTFGINTIALRFGNVYGPRSKHKSSVVAKFIKQALAGEVCEIYGTGKQTRDFIYITDLIDAIIKSSALGIGGEIFQIASSNECTINEVVTVIKNELFEINIDMQIINTDARLGDVMRNYSDTTKAKNILKWQPDVKLQDGIKNTVVWFTQLNNR